MKSGLAGKLVNVSKTNQYDVYIGRGTKWGNPFIIGRDGTREEVIAKHAHWIEHGKGRVLIPYLDELRDKILGCHCHPRSCHGHTLLRLCYQHYQPSFFD